MAPEFLGRVMVLGLGKSGKVAASYAAELIGTRVESLFVAAGERNAQSEAFCDGLAGEGGEGVSFAFGDDALDGDVGTFDLCIASPGIPYWHKLYQRGLAISGELVSEVEFAWRESSASSVWVAITGTNGKTTTTSCCAHILKQCGFKAEAVGNIGSVCLEAVRNGGVDAYVAEVSSYQLYSTRDFAPDIAVMLNITPDHVHWHKTLDAYRDAKFNLLRAVGRTAVLDATNDIVRERVRAYRQMTREQRGFDYIPLGTADGIGGDMRARCGARNAAFIAQDGTLSIAFDGVDHEVGRAADLQIKGEHNASNALAAAAVAVALGVEDVAIARALASFEPLAHRIEPCGEVAGVSCYNDSKATNVDAAVKALSAFPGKRVVVLLGGDDKGTDLEQLVAAVHGHAAVAVCFGAAGPRLAEAFESAAAEAPAGFRLARAGKMQGALDEALSAAEPGDVVLLSPACASFDEFRSFEERGDVFKRLVANRAARSLEEDA